MRLFEKIALVLFICWITAFSYLIGVSSQHQQHSQHQVTQEAPDPNLETREIARTVGQKLMVIWDRTWEDPVAFYTFVLGVFTALLAVVSATQIAFLNRADKTTRIAANAAQDSADIAKQALVAGQRAFISVSFRASAHKNFKDGKISVYSFTPVWFNAGNTPTRNMENHVNIYAFEEEVAGDWDFPNLWNAGVPAEKRGSVPLSASPKNSVDGQSVAVPISTIQEVIDGRKFLYFWGSATYNDVFPETERHVTRFAVRIVAGGDPEEAERMSFSYPFLNRYNCSDEECKRLGFPVDWKPRTMDVG